MSSSDYVFILGSQKPLVLHPFQHSSRYESEAVGAILGRYGTGDVPKAADPLRATLYEAMEKGARRYFLDKGYYIRIGLTVVTFISVYLFLSIFVRDPVPLIDELLLGTLSAVAVFFASERKALSSPRHLESVLRLRRAIDGAFFSESRVVDLLESWRDESLALGPAAFYKAMPEPARLSLEELEEASALCSLLSARWKSKAIVAELYDASLNGKVPGSLLDKAERKLGKDECALALAYLRLLPLVTGKTE
jgi:hypothetical protein